MLPMTDCSGTTTGADADPDQSCWTITGVGAGAGVNPHSCTTV